MGVGGGGEGEVSAILFGIARLLQRAEHQEAENSFFGLAGNLLCEFLVHPRRDVHFFRYFDFADALAGASRIAAIGFELHPLDGQRADSQ